MKALTVAEQRRNARANGYSVGCGSGKHMDTGRCGCPEPVPDLAPACRTVQWKWRKWTFGFWTDPENCTRFGIDIGPLEICWRSAGYRP